VVKVLAFSPAISGQFIAIHCWLRHCYSRRIVRSNGSGIYSRLMGLGRWKRDRSVVLFIVYLYNISTCGKRYASIAGSHTHHLPSFNHFQKYNHSVLRPW
jgi:hypothetical protein